MKFILSIAVLIFSIAAPEISFSAGLYPWEFGMSKSDVSSFSEFGPYRSFANGDIETFNGTYEGKKENIQFFFDSKGLLRKIGVYLYEGKDIDAAREVWKRAYSTLLKNYGKVEIPNIKIETNDTSADLESLSIAAAANVDLVGKTQMAPVDQPKDVFVFSSFARQDVQDVRFFYVILYFKHP